MWSTWEVWRALKKLELLSATPRATLTHLSCSPNFPRASYLDERTLTYEPIVNYTLVNWCVQYVTTNWSDSQKDQIDWFYYFLLRIKNNPKTKAVDNKTDLQIALNTAQLGRTFQDRSHVIILKPRSKLPMKFQHSNIYYINGMGKRGNIVQAYPAMEYRFYPERLTVTTDDVVCFVWSGEKEQSISYELLWPQSYFILFIHFQFRCFIVCLIIYLFIASIGRLKQQSEQCWRRNSTWEKYRTYELFRHTTNFKT